MVDSLHLPVFPKRKGNHGYLHKNHQGNHQLGWAHSWRVDFLGSEPTTPQSITGSCFLISIFCHSFTSNFILARKSIIVTLNCFSLKTLVHVVRTVTKMKQEKTDCKEKSRRTPLDRLCCMSGLLLSIACSVAIIHVEFRIQEQQRLISQATTTYDQMKTEILRKLQQNYKRWGDPRGKTWQKNKGRFSGSCLL